MKLDCYRLCQFSLPLHQDVGQVAMMDAWMGAVVPVQSQFHSANMARVLWSKASVSRQQRTCFRKPVRLTATVSAQVHDLLAEHSTLQGRSLSNLAAFILEDGLRRMESTTNHRSSYEKDRAPNGSGRPNGSEHEPGEH